MSDVGIVYHLAAKHRYEVRPVSLYNEINVGGVENLVYGLEKNGIKKLISELYTKKRLQIVLI